MNGNMDGTIQVTLTREEAELIIQVLALARPQGDASTVLRSLRMIGSIAQKLEEASRVWQP